MIYSASEIFLLILFFLWFVPKIINSSREANLCSLSIHCFSTWEFLWRLFDLSYLEIIFFLFTSVIFPTGFYRTFKIIGNIIMMGMFYFDLMLNLLLSLLAQYADFVTILFGKLYLRFVFINLLLLDFINLLFFVQHIAKLKDETFYCWHRLFLVVLFEQRGGFPFLDVVLDLLPI